MGMDPESGIVLVPWIVTAILSELMERNWMVTESPSEGGSQHLVLIPLIAGV